MVQAALASAVTILQAAVVVLAVAGERILPFVNIPALDQLFEQYKNKRLQVGLGAWFLGNLIKTQLSSTGALEVFFDGQLVRRSCALHNSPCLLRSNVHLTSIVEANCQFLFRKGPGSGFASSLLVTRDVIWKVLCNCRPFVANGVNAFFPLLNDCQILAVQFDDRCTPSRKQSNRSDSAHAGFRAYLVALCSSRISVTVRLTILHAYCWELVSSVPVKPSRMCHECSSHRAKMSMGPQDRCRRRLPIAWASILSRSTVSIALGAVHQDCCSSSHGKTLLMILVPC